MKLRIRTNPDGLVYVMNEHGDVVEGVVNVAFAAAAGQKPVTTVTLATDAVDVETDVKPEGLSFIRITARPGRG